MNRMWDSGNPQFNRRSNYCIKFGKRRIGQATQLPAVQESPLVGHPALNFDLKTLNEQTTVSLHDLLGKQPIRINAWVSWCPPCQQETPDLVVMSKKYASKIQFVGVNMTSDHDSVTALSDSMG